MLNQLIIAAFLICFFPLSGLADQAENKGIDRMAKDLNLSDDQKTKVQGIISTEKSTVESIFKEQAEKLKQAQEKTKQELQQVLTPEQMTKLEKKMAESAQKAKKK